MITLKYKKNFLIHFDFSINYLFEIKAKMKSFLIILFAILPLIIASPLSVRSRSRVTPKKSLKTAKDTLDINYRLPNETVPIFYNVVIKTKIDEGISDFSGTVEIRLLVKQNTSKIVLHSKQQSIENLELFSDPARPLAFNLVPTTFKLLEDEQILEISTVSGNNLTAGKEYLLAIDFTGVLRDDNVGFYRSSYVNKNENRVWLAATQFEETEARQAFPCYDEPQIRASFALTIEHHKNYTAISNWPQENTMEIGGSENIWTIFQVTEPVQTYLVAFIISDFEFSSSNDSSEIPHRVFAKPPSIDKNEEKSALSDGVKLLSKFQEHFKVSYIPPKMDQVALPDFDAGAMENWGLVTYREEYLLLNDNSTSREKKNVLTIISHEFAHQWFGDAVNPMFWNYLWLNEGFATLYEYFMASLVYPESELMDDFVVDIVHNALEYDSYPYTRPMTYYVESPDEIADLFDNIAYDKAGSVLRMFQNALGDETWTKGLTKYLTTMEMSAATSDDLYEGIQSAVDDDVRSENLNISTAMRSWEIQAGYPVLLVSRYGNQLKFEQESFSIINETSEKLWWIPVNYALESSGNFSSVKPDFWIPANKSYQAELSDEDVDGWIVVNKQQGFYYRVNYDETLWTLIINQLNGKDHTKIHLLNRAQLIDDSHNLAQAGKIPYSTTLEILEYLKNEIDYIPWVAVNLKQFFFQVKRFKIFFICFMTGKSWANIA